MAEHERDQKVRSPHKHGKALCVCERKCVRSHDPWPEPLQRPPWHIIAKEGLNAVGVAVDQGATTHHFRCQISTLLPSDFDRHGKPTNAQPWSQGSQQRHRLPTERAAATTSPVDPKKQLALRCERGC
mmetsp:Transcript_25838/g.65144  ORF Transcript_25838/g.65144 Transcript_25838/m.65144 type:complete len:128 (+) Transcript_25838:17-400(+)